MILCMTPHYLVVVIVQDKSNYYNTNSSLINQIIKSVRSLGIASYKGG